MNNEVKHYKNIMLFKKVQMQRRLAKRFFYMILGDGTNKSRAWCKRHVVRYICCVLRRKRSVCMVHKILRIETLW